MSQVTRFTYTDNPDFFIAAHRLATAQLPPARLRSLLEAADQHPVHALALDRTILRRPPIGLTDRQADRLRDAQKSAFPPEMVRAATNLGVTIITFQDPRYPGSLLPLADMPPLLFVRGEIPELEVPFLAIVGSRRATAYGRSQAQRFARTFVANSGVIVSGGAAGIDTVAHSSALDSGGKTVAVLGCGVDHAYPSENKALFARIADGSGAIISEYPLGTTPEPWRFPARNRIIAGMANVTVVIESPSDSGALITARCAAEYGRSVYAVPGSVETGKSRGCHDLIRDGAFIADSPEDVLLALATAKNARPVPAAPLDLFVDAVPSRAETVQRPEPSRAGSPPADPLSPEEDRFLAQITAEPRHIDEILAAASISVMQGTVAATLLEMKGRIRRLPGNLFVRATS